MQKQSKIMAEKIYTKKSDIFYAEYATAILNLSFLTINADAKLLRVAKVYSPFLPRFLSS